MKKCDTPSLASLDMNKTIDTTEYNKELEKLQTRLQKIQQAYLFSKEKAVIVFEGWDAAGKGGTIRRITSVLDARGIKVWPISAPRNYYLERHYLTRFWERLPPQGAISIFDRSWYGRVLVERVENLISPKVWKKAYQEINDFERMLYDDNTKVLKFFLHITPDVQLKRFEDRLTNPLKRWKLCYEDFRNREKWEDYETAIEEMFQQTSTDYAPWHAIPSNDKKFARIKVISTICKQLEKGQDLSPRPLDKEVIKGAKEIFGSEYLSKILS